MIRNVYDSDEYLGILERSGYTELIEIDDITAKALIQEYKNNFGPFGTKNLGYYSETGTLQTVLSYTELYSGAIIAHSLASATRFELRSKIAIYNELFEIVKREEYNYFMAYYEKGHPWHEKIFGDFNRDSVGSKLSRLQHYELYNCPLGKNKEIARQFLFSECTEKLSNELGFEPKTGVCKKKAFVVISKSGEKLANLIFEKANRGTSLLGFFNMIKVINILKNDDDIILQIMEESINLYSEQMLESPSYIAVEENSIAVPEEIKSELFLYENPITCFILDLYKGAAKIQKIMIGNMQNRKNRKK